MVSGLLMPARRASIKVATHLSGYEKGETNKSYDRHDYKGSHRN